MNYVQVKKKSWNDYRRLLIYQERDVEMKKKKVSIKSVIILQLVVMVYTLSGVAAKGASGYDMLSWQFIFFYGVEIIILGVYAILWQQIIKKFDLSIAYANRSMAIVWSLIWAVVFFGEEITVNNIIGVFIVLAGTMLVNSDGE